MTTVGHVGCIYAMRYGDSHQFKIGITAAEVEKRRKRLQTGSPMLLTVFRTIEHPAYKEGERFLHQRLAASKLAGGTENFALSDDDLNDAFAAVRIYMDEDVPRRLRVTGFAKLESTGDLLPATDPVLNARDQLLQIRRSRDQLRPEIERLAALTKALNAEEERLRLIVMDAIGPARGIDGVATWDTVDGPRRFDSDWLRADDPELFDQYRTKFDAAQFRKERPSEHRAHMRVKRHRQFHWLDQPTDPDSVTSKRTESNPWITE